MSLTGALSSAVSALHAQSTAIAMSADNLANSGTYGYKSTHASFESLVTGASSTFSYSSGGVLARSMTETSAQGLLTSSGTSTNVAIDGNGFFPVRDGLDGGDVFYTRNGEFSVDSDGFLNNGGFYLLGWKTDADGKITGRVLEPIDVDSIASTAAATTEAAIKANLPADAATNATFNTKMDLYDSLGAAHSVEITWTKTAENAWRADFADPVLANDSTSVSGDVTSGPITITFNADGTLASTTPNPPTITISGWTTGAADSTIALDLGGAGTATGLSQYASGKDTPDVDLDSLSQNGIPYGKLRSVSIDDKGTVIGSYSNGQQIALFKIPVATFTNPNGLSAMSGGIYAETSESGSTVLHESGEGGAGDIQGGALEASTTDTSEEFTKIVAAQQAYSSAAQIITTVDKMFETLIASVR
jgi:flagellar hook protein FlgE